MSEVAPVTVRDAADVHVSGWLGGTMNKPC
jgi:hypothetical protein